VRRFHGLRAGGVGWLRRLLQPENGQHHLLPIRIPFVQIDQHVEIRQQSGTELAQHAAAARGQSQEPNLDQKCIYVVPVGHSYIINVAVRDESKMYSRKQLNSKIESVNSHSPKFPASGNEK
jgi:hypothetical protein